MFAYAGWPNCFIMFGKYFSSLIYQGPRYLYLMSKLAIP